MSETSTIAAGNAKKFDRFRGGAEFEDRPLDRMLFFGREREIEELVDQIQTSSLVILFGKSALGKTSLLQAGVYPRLGKRHCLPVPLRVDQPDRKPVDLLASAVQEACDRGGVEYTEGERTGWWEFFKTATFWKNDTWLTPVLVLDQFEEIFTRNGPESRKRIAREIGQLVRGGIPERVRDRLEAGQRLSFGEGPPNLKVIICLRDEYVGTLQELLSEVPGIFNNRMRVKPMTREQGRQVMVETAAYDHGDLRTDRFEFEDETLRQLLDFLSDDEGHIEPFQLQILCRNQEADVPVRGTSETRHRVPPGALGGELGMNKVMKEFYLDAISKLQTRRQRRSARRLCENGLLTRAGYRDSMGSSRISQDYDLDDADLEVLIDAHLLRRERRGPDWIYELAHDSLCSSVESNRPIQIPRSFRMGFVSVVVAAVVLAAVLNETIGAKREADVERERAEAAEKEAESQSDRFRRLHQEALDDLTGFKERNAELRAENVAANERTQKIIDRTAALADGEPDAVKAQLKTELEQVKRKLKEAQRSRAETTPQDRASYEPEMVRIDPGTFWMGSEAGEEDEKPRTQATLSHSFEIGRYEVTFDEYATFVLLNDGHELPPDKDWGEERRPVINVTWLDAVAYAEWLSQQTGKPYRLPSEAEWEYAARAGTSTKYWWGDEVEAGRANCKDCGSDQSESTMPVGQLQNNPFGLYDTAGNVWKWVQDNWHPSYSGAPANGAAWIDGEEGSARVLRGGSWRDHAGDVRSARRAGLKPKERGDFLGFRLARGQEADSARKGGGAATPR